MSVGRHRRAKGMLGWTGIGAHGTDVMSGFRGAGIARLTPAHTGATPTMIATRMAGTITRATGITKTMGITMITTTTITTTETVTSF
jgi:hypothetical protein